MYNGTLTAAVYFEKRIRVKSPAVYDPQLGGSLSGHDGHLYTTVIATRPTRETSSNINNNSTPFVAYLSVFRCLVKALLSYP
jgi:hypothetical protein